MLKKIILLLVTIASIGWPNTIDWSALAKEDLQACRRLIQEQHPAFADTEQTHAEIKRWWAEGGAAALKLAEEASSFAGYKYALASYIAGFRDGHLSIRTPHKGPYLWPQCLLAYRGGRFWVVSEFSSEAPPHGAEVIRINGKHPECLMRSNIFPYMSNDPAIESSWTLLAPWLLIDSDNPWAEPIDTITYRLNEVETEYKLQWTLLEQEHALPSVQLAAYGPPPECSIHEFGDGGVWISLPTFNPDKKEGVQEALEEIVERLPLLRERPCIVFDLRANSGGSSSWVVKILTALYGTEYLGSLPHIKNENALADDRLTPASLADWERYGLFDPEMKAALERGEPFHRRKTDVHFFADIKKLDASVPNPVSGNVYLLTDGHCFSSGLIFADSILSVPGVLHIGAVTDADTQFSQPFPRQLPSGKSRLLIPSMIRRNWERGNNEPYYPAYTYDGYMGDQESLEAWVLYLN